MLNHASVMKLYTAFEDEDEIKLVTDLYRGGDLGKRLSKYNEIFPYRDALEITKRILAGLAHLEKLHIVHRDLKFENVVFKYPDNSYELAIIDFGFALRWTDYKVRPPGYGTLGYYAPEILEISQSMFNSRADVYSLGIMMYQMYRTD